jgi:DNA-binding MarR family transcriptional regulator
LDSRRFNWVVSSEGKDLLQKVEVIVLNNRKQALEGLSEHRINLLKKSLEEITNNCNSFLEEQSEK